MQTLGKTKHITTGVSMPKELFQKLETLRQYENRSSFYSRLLMNASKEKKN
jgi:metal-responsive CopG/Arc/MetJ family transcriptional regulator